MTIMEKCGTLATSWRNFFSSSMNRTESSGGFWTSTAREAVFYRGCAVNGNLLTVLEAPDGQPFVSDDYAGAIQTITKMP